MDAATVVTLIGGLGMFLLGIHHLTEGLKGLAGDGLRRTLQRVVSGRFSAVTSGVVFTAAVQSSTAAILTVIGFVSAGLVTFPQAVGVIVGATLGTTTTPWMVAYFGLRVNVSAGALPMLGIGALLWLIAKGRARSLGAVLAGFGLLFTGISYMQDGMAGVEWNLDAFGDGVGAMWLLCGLGAIMTIIMQSSSAAVAVTLVALNAGSLTFEQGCAMVVGQSVGSAATTALVAIGGSTAVRRSALAHVVFSVSVAVLSMIFLTPLTWAAAWVGTQLGDPNGVLALAAFSSIFKFAGILAFYPWLGKYAELIERLSGKGSETAVAHLDPLIAKGGGAVALEAAWRALLEVSRGAVAAVRARLAGEATTYAPTDDAVQPIEHFLQSLSLESTDVHTYGPRLVRVCHAMDHLIELHDDLKRPPPSASEWKPPTGFESGAKALAAWLDATRDPEAKVDAAVVKAIEDASKQSSVERKAEREKLLEAIALQRMPAATARAGLDTIVWGDGALYHSWRLAESLRIAAGG